MSHITTVAVEIRDLEAVKALCREKGWTFKEGKKTYEWFGEWVKQGDNDIRPSDEELATWGHCDHAIGIPGEAYELGLQRSGNAYRLRWDGFKEWRKDHGGPSKHGLDYYVGKTGSRFLQGYGIAKAEMEARKRGLNVRRVPGSNGSVKLVLTGASL